MEIPSPDELNARKQKEGFGPFLGIIIIVALMAAGGIYFLVIQEMQRQATPPATQEQARS
jgi:uncharacterized protein HemX